MYGNPLKHDPQSAEGDMGQTSALPAPLLHCGDIRLQGGTCTSSRADDLPAKLTEMPKHWVGVGAGLAKHLLAQST